MRVYSVRKKSVNEYMEKIKAKRRRIAVLSTSVCLVVAILAAVLFVPYDTTPPDVSMYAGSDYYTLIQRLNEATYNKPDYKNNFEALVGCNNIAVNSNDRIINEKLERLQKQEEEGNLFEAIVKAGFSGMD